MPRLFLVQSYRGDVVIAPYERTCGCVVGADAHIRPSEIHGVASNR